MVEKKTLVRAMEEAQQISIRYPGVTVYVMDKPRKHAIATAFGWIYNERLLDGWTCYCKFRDGRIV